MAREGIRIGEDELTRAVLGLLRYLPPQLWFQDFLKELRKRNPSASPMLENSSSLKVSLWPSYPVPEEWRKAFWRPRGAQPGILELTNLRPEALHGFFPKERLGGDEMESELDKAEQTAVDAARAVIKTFDFAYSVLEEVSKAIVGS
ncbi:MAG: hypothetical protein JRJ66_05085 [Deltaproteobacteria bacterium]|nr:hypothetical protein [Deltaproteobacteria bacterium]MBW2045913.1 hypothetical protein [Deltaproteobacteria bacterium]MBW2299521.1 hypothetical protein [Deltaproteobacteria bacterium]